MVRTVVMIAVATCCAITGCAGKPPATAGDYCAMVSRKPMRPNVEVWAIRLRDPLPIIPIPLKGDIPDALLDLQALLDRVYDAAGYEDYLYETPTEPPLPEADALWAQAIVAGVLANVKSADATG